MSIENDTKVPIENDTKVPIIYPRRPALSDHITMNLRHRLLRKSMDVSVAFVPLAAFVDLL